jgi:hypothetical protein
MGGGGACVPLLFSKAKLSKKFISLFLDLFDVHYASTSASTADFCVETVPSAFLQLCRELSLPRTMCVGHSDWPKYVDYS